MKNTTVKIVIDNKKLSNEKFGIYLRIIKNRKRKLISLGLKCSKNEFSNETFNKNRTNYKSENELLLQLKNKANFIIREYRLDDYDFTLNEFENRFRGKDKKQKIKVIDFFDEIIEEMIKSGRISNASAYKETKRALLKFNGVELYFEDITPTFLEKFEVYLREKGNEDGGIAFKMRELRAIYNKAINRDLVSFDSYPFKTYKVSKLKSKNNKRALTIEEFIRIRDLNLENFPHLREAHNYFLFSFYTRGMNFIDMMKLKWSNVRNGRIYYTRSKTKGQFSIEIIENVHKTLDFYKRQNRPTEYVFPIILNENSSHQQVANRKHKVLSRYNKNLKEIGELAEVENKLTSYVARHSFATILKLTGTSTDIISELMGHSDVQITMTYLKSFDTNVLDDANRTLLDL